MSFNAVLVALMLMDPIQQERAVLNGSRSAFNLQAIRDGVRFIVKSPIILSSMLLDFMATFFSSANTLLPFVAQDILKVGAVQYGWLASAQSVGGIMAGLSLSQRTKLRRQGRLLLQAVVVFGLATVVFGISRNYWLTFFTLALVGGSDAVSTILRNTIRQLQPPDPIRGRMVSVNQLFFMGGPQLGEVEAGLVAQAFGTPAAIVSGGMGCILAVAVVAILWPQLTRYRGDEPILAGAAATARLK